LGVWRNLVSSSSLSLGAAKAFAKASSYGTEWRENKLLDHRGTPCSVYLLILMQRKLPPAELNGCQVITETSAHSCQAFRQISSEKEEYDPFPSSMSRSVMIHQDSGGLWYNYCSMNTWNPTAKHKPANQTGQPLFERSTILLPVVYTIPLVSERHSVTLVLVPLLISCYRHVIIHTKL